MSQEKTRELLVQTAPIVEDWYSSKGLEVPAYNITVMDEIHPHNPVALAATGFEVDAMKKANTDSLRRYLNRKYSVDVDEKDFREYLEEVSRVYRGEMNFKLEENEIRFLRTFTQISSKMRSGAKTVLASEILVHEFSHIIQNQRQLFFPYTIEPIAYYIQKNFIGGNIPFVTRHIDRILSAYPLYDFGYKILKKRKPSIKELFDRDFVRKLDEEISEKFPVENSFNEEKILRQTFQTFKVHYPEIIAKLKQGKVTQKDLMEQFKTKSEKLASFYEKYPRLAEITTEQLNEYKYLLFDK